MEWLKKEQSRREKSGKPSVEKVAVKRKVSWKVAELPQLGVVVKFFPPTKPRCVYNNAHNEKHMPTMGRGELYRWVYAIPRPGDGNGGFVIDAEEKWSFYWSMRRLIGLENIEMIFDNITVMIFPVFATAPV
jgi:hypothetical protein